MKRGKLLVDESDRRFRAAVQKFVSQKFSITVKFLNSDGCSENAIEVTIGLLTQLYS